MNPATSGQQLPPISALAGLPGMQGGIVLHQLPAGYHLVQMPVAQAADPRAAELREKAKAKVLHCAHCPRTFTRWVRWRWSPRGGVVRTGNW